MKKIIAVAALTVLSFAVTSQTFARERNHQHNEMNRHYVHNEHAHRPDYRRNDRMSHHMRRRDYNYMHARNNRW